MEIKQDAIFIADAHYNYKRDNLHKLLVRIDQEELKCSQLFLMGDIFDFLAGEVSYFVKINKQIIDLINKISLKIEVVYLEGNHDYNLKKIFPSTKVLSRGEQPLNISLEGKNVSLSHGDIFVDGAYNIYCSVIRNSNLLKFLNLFDFSAWITKKIEKKLASKKICHKISNFKDIIEKRIYNYNAQIVIEGHYHQGKCYDFNKIRYINIPSLACSKEYGRYKGTEFNWEKL